MRTIRDAENMIRIEFSTRDYFIFTEGFTNSAQNVRGCRIRRNYISDNLSHWLKDMCQRRTKDSTAFVYSHPYNHGTHRYPDIEPHYLELVHLCEVKECAKSYKCDGRLYKKSNIVAYLYTE